MIRRTNSHKFVTSAAISSLVVFSIIGMSARNSTGLLIAAPSTAEKKSVRDLEDELNVAVVKGDVSTFDRLFAEDFTHTSQDGHFRTRAEWMKGRVQGKTNYVSFDVDDLQIRIFGETAVATGMSKPSWREQDGSLASGRFRFLRVWVKRDGRWQAVAFQATRINAVKE